ncbi:MAG: PilZ domain-containing protein [Syntrophales bacterium]
MNEAAKNTEKRQFPRVTAQIPVRYRELDGADTVSTGTLTTDVSTGGLRFRTNKFLSTACRLLLQVDIPTREKPIEVVSRVAWVREANGEGGPCYQVGSQFMEITKKDQELIAAYLSSR